MMKLRTTFFRSASRTSAPSRNISSLRPSSKMVKNATISTKSKIFDGSYLPKLSVASLAIAKTSSLPSVPRRFFADEKDVKESSNVEGASMEASKVAKNNDLPVAEPRVEDDEHMAHEEEEEELSQEEGEGEEGFSYDNVLFTDFSEKRQVLLREVMKKVDDGKHEEGLELVVKEIEKEPGDSELHYLKGCIQLEYLNMKEDAKLSLNKALEINPQYLRAHLFKGTAAMRSRQYDEAVQAFTEAITINPEQPGPYSLKAEALLLLGGREKEGIEICVQSLKLASQAEDKKPKTYGEVLQNTDEPATGSQKMEFFPLPDNQKLSQDITYLMKAAFHSKLGENYQTLEALQECIISLRSEETKERVRLQVANAFYYVDFEESVMRFQELYEQTPWNPHVALAYWTTNYVVQSKAEKPKAFEHMLKHQLQFPLIYHGKGTSTEVAKEALEMWKKEAYPADAKFVKEVTGVFQSLAENFDDAIATFDEILKENPNSISAHLGKAHALNAQRKYYDVANTYKQLQRLLQANPELDTPRDVTWHYAINNLITALVEEGRWKEIYKWGAESLKQIPEDSEYVTYMMHISLHKLNKSHTCTVDEKKFFNETEFDRFPPAREEDLVDDAEFDELVKKTAGKKGIKAPGGKKSKKDSDEDDEDSENFDSETMAEEGAVDIKEKKPRKARSKKEEDTEESAEEKPKKTRAKKKKDEEGEVAEEKPKRSRKKKDEVAEEPTDSQSPAAETTEKKE